MEDGSSDHSREVLNRYSKVDRRIKVLVHEDNKGTLVARKAGILQAKGEYVTFLDPDDFYANSHALDLLYYHVKRQAVDILQFSIKMVFADNVHKEYPHNWLKVKPRFINGSSNILRTFFMNGDSNAYLWNKIFRADICKLACYELPNSYLICATDTVMFFVICYYANSFHALQTEQITSYRVGSGISTAGGELVKFSYQICGRYIAWTIIKTFLLRHEHLDRYTDVYYSATSSIQISFLRWFSRLSIAESQAAFPLLTRYISPSNIVQYFGRHYRNKADQLLQKIGYVLPVPKQLNAISTIGILCTDLDQYQFAMLLYDLRYANRIDKRKYVVFTDRDPRIVFHKTEDIIIINISSIPDRMSKIISSVREYGIEGIVSCSLLSDSTFYDLLLLRLELVPVLVHLGYTYSYQRQRQINACYNSVLLAQTVVFSHEVDFFLFSQRNTSSYTNALPSSVIQNHGNSVIIFNATESDKDEWIILAELLRMISNNGTAMRLLVISSLEEIALDIVQTIQRRNAIPMPYVDIILNKNISFVSHYLETTSVLINTSEDCAGCPQHFEDVLRIPHGYLFRDNIENLATLICSYITNRNNTEFHKRKAKQVLRQVIGWEDCIRYAFLTPQ